MRGTFTHRRGLLRLLAAAAGLLAATLATVAWRRAHAPRVWKPEEVAVAFWSWRAEAPAQGEVERAAKATGARTLFMRAGQLDYARGKVSRVRAFEGRAPAGIELHLVYNATPALLSEFERVEEAALADAVAETFRADSLRVSGEGVSVVGLQLDIDVPTRLLPRYARVLREARARLDGRAKISVTGLPTWMSARGSLAPVLDAVDFWVPQFYGAEIPATEGARMPISSAAEVRRWTERAREMGRPFYAGLAAYGYALLYTEKGKLVELRGDFDPARAASDRNFELVERRAFGAGDAGPAEAAPHPAEWRYVYRAREDALLGDAFVRAGERLVLDVPSSESLRASARGVREAAGDKLLGICVFRLPTRGDRTTLSLAQVAAALEDREAKTSTSVSVRRAPSEPAGASPASQLLTETNRLPSGPASQPPGGPTNRLPAGASNRLLVEALNDGETAAAFGEGALTLTLRVPRGSLRGVASLEGFDTFETLCEPGAEPAQDPSRQASSDGNARGTSLRPCGSARASVVRLGARSWNIGSVARAGLSFEPDAPASLPATVAVRRDDGGEWSRALSVSLKP